MKQLEREIVGESHGHGRDVSERVTQIQRHDRRHVGTLFARHAGEQRDQAERQVAAHGCHEIRGIDQ